MAFNLINFYVQTGDTRSDIRPSVVSFEAMVSVTPDPGGMTAKLTYPVLDTGGSTITIAKGMTIWPSYYQVSPEATRVPIAGIITDVKQQGDTLTVTAESLIAPLLRSVYTGTYSSLTNVSAIISATIASVTPAAPYHITGSYSQYRATTGGGLVPMNVQVDDLAVTTVPISALFQYFAELLPNTTLTSNLCVVFPSYYTSVVTGRASVYLQYTGYGHHYSAAVTLSYDAELISMVEWSDATDSILNDVTVSIKDGSSYHATDATSITAYGQHPTTLSRPMYYTDTTYARKHADTMVNNLKDPKLRCTVYVDGDQVLYWNTVNGVYTVTDDITAMSGEMTLRAYTLYYPSNIARCEFDNAALNRSSYGTRSEARLASLEAERLSPTSTPTVASLNSGLITVTGTNNDTTNKQLSLSKVGYGVVDFNQWYTGGTNYGLNIGGAVGTGLNINKYNGYCGVNTTSLSTYPFFVNGAVGCGDITSSGRVSGAGNQLCSAVPTNITAMAAATYTQITLGTEEYDFGGCFASNAFTAPVAGKYLVCAQLQVDAVDAAKTASYYILKNYTTGVFPGDGTVVMTSTQSSGVASNICAGGSKIIILAANDTLKLWGRQTDAVSRNSSSSAAATYMSIQYLGA